MHKKLLILAVGLLAGSAFAASNPCGSEECVRDHISGGGVGYDLREQCRTGANPTVCGMFLTSARINGAGETLPGTYAGPALTGSGSVKLDNLCQYEGAKRVPGTTWMALIGDTSRPFMARFNATPAKNALLVHPNTLEPVTEGGSIGNDTCSDDGHIGCGLNSLNGGIGGKWTGLKNDGTESNTCLNWTSANSGNLGTGGLSNDIDLDDNNMPCARYRAVVCLQTGAS